MYLRISDLYPIRMAEIMDYSEKIHTAGNRITSTIRAEKHTPMVPKASEE